MALPKTKTEWKRWPAASPDHILNAVDSVAKDYGLTRNGMFNLLIRIGLPLARAHSVSLKSQIRKAVDEIRDGSKTVPIPETLSPPVKGNRDRKT